MRILKIAIIGAVLVTAGAARVGGGQMLPANRLPWSNQVASMSQPDIIRHAEQQRMLVKDRQKRLAEDTEKLLRLTTALKEQIDDSDKNVLSLDLVKKADEIEKLAHSVKERIKG